MTVSVHPAASAALFNIAAHTEKQLRQFRSAALSFMIALLSGKGFMEKVCVHVWDVYVYYC